jgi:hypothetical protein
MHHITPRLDLCNTTVNVGEARPVATINLIDALMQVGFNLEEVVFDFGNVCAYAVEQLDSEKPHH